MKDTRVLPVRKKRRSRPSLPALLRTYWIVQAVVVVFAIWGTVSLVNWPGFHPSIVTVAGASRVGAADIRRAAAVDRHANVWLADTRAMERRIEAIPYVDTARIHRHVPAAVSIEITERSPEACVHFAGHDPSRDVTIDATRRVLATGCDDAPQLQYVITGKSAAPGHAIASSELATLQNDRAVLVANGRSFIAYELDRFGGLEATMPDGIAVRFGDDEALDQKERLIGPVLAAVAPRLALVVAVDLRAPTAPVVDFR